LAHMVVVSAIASMDHRRTVPMALMVMTTMVA
jgi:uncharacterized membrane protein (UPF0136 family)